MGRFRSHSSKLQTARDGLGFRGEMRRRSPFHTPKNPLSGSVSVKGRFSAIHTRSSMFRSVVEMQPLKDESGSPAEPTQLWPVNISPIQRIGEWRNRRAGAPEGFRIVELGGSINERGNVFSFRFGKEDNAVFRRRFQESPCFLNGVLNGDDVDCGFPSQMQKKGPIIEPEDRRGWKKTRKDFILAIYSCYPCLCAGVQDIGHNFVWGRKGLEGRTFMNIRICLKDCLGDVEETWIAVL